MHIAAEVNQTHAGSTTFIQCDVTKEADMKHLVDRTLARHGRLDCLINNVYANTSLLTIMVTSS